LFSTFDALSKERACEEGGSAAQEILGGHDDARLVAVRVLTDPAVSLTDTIELIRVCADSPLFAVRLRKQTR